MTKYFANLLCCDRYSGDSDGDGKKDFALEFNAGRLVYSLILVVIGAAVGVFVL